MANFWYTEEQSGFRLANAGLGPGYLHWFSVAVDDKQQPHWRAMLQALGLGLTPAYSFSVPAEGWYREALDPQWIFFIAREHPLHDSFRAASDRVELTGCYCSLWDECWLFARTLFAPEPIQDCESLRPEVHFIAPPPRAERPDRQ